MKLNATWGRAASKTLLSLLLPLAVGLSGCASLWEQPQNTSAADMEELPALGNVEYYTFQLAEELFAGQRPARQARYAVTGFVPVDTMRFNANDQGPLMMLGHQLEQGMITEASKRGFTAREFKLANSILMGETSDSVLSRDISKLSDSEHVDYYITGTIVPQEAGAIVNARIISVQNKDVIAAATRFFPAELFWQKEQVTSRNGRLYRTENKG